jgi:hypothetical protein
MGGEHGVSEAKVGPVLPRAAAAVMSCPLIFSGPQPRLL